jgi:hypothetical protein
MPMLDGVGVITEIHLAIGSAGGVISEGIVCRLSPLRGVCDRLSERMHQ